MPRTINKYGQTKVTDLAGVPAGGLKNILINGSFDVWQRGTSFAAIAANAYSADRWKYYKATTGAVHTVSRDTNVPTVTQAGVLASYSLKMACTTADASVAAGDLICEFQIVEGYNWRPLAQKQVTLSFWVYSSKTGTYCVSFANSGQDRSYVAEYTVNSANTWEKKTVTVSPSPSAGTWDYKNGVGLYVRFALMAGSTYQTTANSWQTGNFFGTSNQVDAVDSTSNTFYLTLVQLEEGPLATEFEPRSFQQELAMCQRYFETNVAHGSTPADGLALTGDDVHMGGYAVTTSIVGYKVLFRVTKRTAPTLVFYRNNQYAGTNVWGYYNSGWNAFTAQNGVLVGVHGFDTEWTKAASFTINNSAYLSGWWTADAEL
ncbi:MAG: hypothetical protein K2R98_19505 [Gemmataceae bacterium]|nr:hypothetical protein [Gemmataceae bacterium]